MKAVLVVGDRYPQSFIIFEMEEEILDLERGR